MTTAENLSAQPFTFDRGLEATDPQLFESMQKEWQRQQSQIELIASENIVSQAVLEAQGSVLQRQPLHRP